MPTPEDPFASADHGEEPLTAEETEETNPIVREAEDTGTLVSTILAEPGEIITPDQEAALKRRTLRRLEAAGDAEAKMKRLAVILDAYPLDAVLGAVPWLGDGIMTTLALAYTLKQAMKARLGLPRTAKVFGYHLVDFVAGAVAEMGSPLLATIVDYFVKANEWSSDEFEEHLVEFMEEARRKGVPQDEIDAVLADSRKLKETWERRAAPWKKGREEARTKLLSQLPKSKKPAAPALEKADRSAPPAAHTEPAQH